LGKRGKKVLKEEALFRIGLADKGRRRLQLRGKKGGGGPKQRLKEYSRKREADPVESRLCVGSKKPEAQPQHTQKNKGKS